MIWSSRSWVSDIALGSYLRIIFLLSHFLVEMSMLLEPISIHSRPFGFHDIDDRVKPAFDSRFMLFLLKIFIKSFWIIIEDGLSILWPEEAHLLIPIMACLCLALCPILRITSNRRNFSVSWFRRLNESSGSLNAIALEISL